MTITVIEAAVLALWVGVVGGFVLGWIARTEQNHLYAQSRRRHLAHLTQLTEHEAAQGHGDTRREVLYIPVPMPIPGPGWAQPDLDGPNHRQRIGAGGSPLLEAVEEIGEARCDGVT